MWKRCSIHEIVREKSNAIQINVLFEYVFNRIQSNSIQPISFYKSFIYISGFIAYGGRYAFCQSVILSNLITFSGVLITITIDFVTQMEYQMNVVRCQKWLDSQNTRVVMKLSENGYMNMNIFLHIKLSAAATRHSNCVRKGNVFFILKTLATNSLRCYLVDNNKSNFNNFFHIKLLINILNEHLEKFRPKIN